VRPETIAVRLPCRDRVHVRARVLTTILLIAVAVSSSARADEPLLDFTIVRADTLYDLSHNVFASPSAWREIARINGLRNPDRITPGQVLRIPLRLMRPTLVNGRLVSVTGDVRIGDSAAAVGALLEEGQTVQTGVSSSTVIELADGSRLKLPPSSLASLAASRHYGGRPDAKTTVGALGTSANMSTATPADIQPGGWFAGALRILRGSVEVVATKLQRAKPLEVITPTAVVGVRGTHYRVGLNDDVGASTHAEVLEGAVRFDVPVSSLGVDLTTGLGAIAGPDTSGPVVVKLKPAPDLSDLPTLFDRPVVRFSLTPEIGTVRVQVAADESFDKTVRDQRFESRSEVRIVDLEDGQWYLRMRQVDDRGIEGYDSTRSFVLKARPEPAAPQSPRTGSTQSVGTVNFSWLQNSAAPSVRLQVAEDVEFTRLVIDRDHVAESSSSVEINAAATYFWRLQSIRPNGDHGPFGDSQRLELRPKPGLPTVQRAVDGNTFHFQWTGRDRDRYRLQLARDPAFTDVIREENVDSSQWVQPAPENAGSYYFRYRTIEPNGFISNYSETVMFDVSKSWKLLWTLLPFLLIF